MRSSSWLDILGYVLLFPVFVLDVVSHVVMSFFGSSNINKTNKNKKKTYSQYSTARGNATATRGEPRSSSSSSGTLMSIFRVDGDDHESKTIYEMTQRAVALHGDNRIAMRSRKFVELRKKHENDRFPSKVYDDENGFDDVTYRDLGRVTEQFGKGLRALGLQKKTTGGDDDNNNNNNNNDDSLASDKLVIFENTCALWTLAAQGAMTQSLPVVTCYATLGQDAVVQAVCETQAAALMVNWKDARDFVQLAKENKMPSLRIIIASTHELGRNNTFHSSDFDNQKNGLKVVTSDEVMALGKTADYKPAPPKPADVAVIMYTSGSTGKPKGVVMTHSQLVAGIAGMAANVEIKPGSGTFVSYLPLAHILALQVENVLISYGATLCYSDPHQLSTALGMFEPTIFAGVPKVYEMLKAGLEKKIDGGPTALRVVFRTLLAWKLYLAKHFKITHTPVSNKFFDLIRKKVFGRHLEFAVTGGGPMSAELHDFFRACFHRPLIQGYALTETCVGGCFQALHDERNGVVGPPVSCVEVALQSEPELMDSHGNPYLHTDRVGSKGERILGRGEICMRGPSISSGYFQDPEKTAQDFDKEGFFHTGDIGQFTEDGVVQIIDRKKNLVKLKGGEYVALEAMETAFRASPFVNDLSVVADGDLDVPLAIVCANGDALEKWADQQGIEYDHGNRQSLGNLPEARQQVVQSMKDEGKKAGLSSLELRIKDCHLVVDEEWKPGHGMTASMKLDRKAIRKIHEHEIKEMYERNGVKYSS
mmetsp:Transcript_14623/g.27757  ORF Transcript_14623/g.27757 Transcript_14623/m.27757 type:complete len:763 (-) Transcript_14623:27-2315(-)